jgi:uncharacterized glyoxalase superfamily protein PhnB
VNDAAAAIELYARVFGAKEKLRLADPGGDLRHVELDFGGRPLMLSDEVPARGIRGPEAMGGTTVVMHLHVDDADVTVGRAIAAGAVLLDRVRHHFYGERSGTVRDPFGHEWTVGHRIEELTPEEIRRRYAELLSR